MTDYSDARFWAISGMGYGKGFSPEEAVENYVGTQLANYNLKDLIFKTPAEFEAALRSGVLKPDVWHAPDEATGFVIDRSLHWTGDNDFWMDAELDQKVTA